MFVCILFCPVVKSGFIQGFMVSHGTLKAGVLWSLPVAGTHGDFSVALDHLYYVVWTA